MIVKCKTLYQIWRQTQFLPIFKVLVKKTGVNLIKLFKNKIYLLFL